jgi:uncharacterized membrane protein YgcG
MKASISKVLAILLTLLLLLAAPLAAQGQKATGILRGQITDPSGAVVVGASVSVKGADGQTLSGTSDKLGAYLISGIAAGNAAVEVRASGFTPYQKPDVVISGGQAQQLNIKLEIAVKQEQVTVQGENPNLSVDVNPENNASATILKEKDLEALSDDPDELEQDLLALAGPSAGPNGGQIYIDGFSNGTLPPKSSIREVRINQNPFSAQYDKPGFGRVEVFTKPGTDKWHGQGMFNENNSIFNSRNPYVHGSIPDYHSEMYTGNLGGGVSKRASVFFNGERRDISNPSAVASTPLTPDGEAYPGSSTRTNLSARLDYQLAASNTLTARYQLLKNSQYHLGVGGLALPSQAYNAGETQRTLQVSDTQVISSHVINETRFQYIHDLNTDNALTDAAAINVLGVFQGGGSTYGHASDTSDYYELQNYTSWAVGKHFAKFGGRLRVLHESNDSTSNANGTFTFSSYADYQSNSPSQYNFTLINNPVASLNFADLGVYAEDDWKLRPNLTLSYGMRFETQSSIHDQADFAPRVGVSWGLGSAKSAPKTVLRLGYGIFFDRFNSPQVLQAQRVNGVTEEQFVIQNPAGYPNKPCETTNACTALSGSSPTVYQINPNLHAPYSMQTAVSVERQLGPVGTLSVTYLNTRGVHQLLTENVNAPEGNDPNGTRPLGDIGNVYQYNSEGIFKQNQLITNVQIRLSQKLSLMGFYALGKADSDTSGVNSFPSNQYHLTSDYGRASFDVRQRLFLSGTASLAHNIRISPFVVANSGAPFNIVLAQDLNGDSIFNDRPSFAPRGSAPGPTLVATQYGLLNLNPGAADARIPVNNGNGPSNVTVNVRLSKTFGFGAETKQGASSSQDQGGSGRGGSGGGGGRGGGLGRPSGMGSIFGPSNTTRRYNLTFTAMARNIFNTWNPGTPVGTVSQPCAQAAAEAGTCSYSTPYTFRSVGLAGGPFSSGSANRRIDLQAMFSF